MIVVFGLRLTLISVGGVMRKLYLFVKVRKQGAYVASVPVGRLVELSGYRKRHWPFVDGWLILEAF